MRRLRTVIVGLLLAGAFVNPADAAKDDDHSDPPIPVSGRSSVTYYDNNGGLHSTTSIPSRSVMRRGGSSDVSIHRSSRTP